MKTRHLYIFLLFNLITSGLLFSQDNNFNSAQQIKWKGIINHEVSENHRVDFLYFDRAIYDARYDFIPAYFTRIKINGSIESAKASLSAAVYENLTEPESRLAAKSTLIQKDIQPSVEIGYERGDAYAMVTFLPLRKNESTGQYEKLVSFKLDLIPSYSGSARKSTSYKTYANNSVLSTGTWYRIGVANSGIHKIDYAFLKSIGMDVDDIDPRNIRIYGNSTGMLPFPNAGFRHDDLQENAIEVKGENDGVFDKDDYILFWGEGPHVWNYNSSDQRFHHKFNLYTDTTYYFITADLSGTAKRIETQTPSSQAVTHYVTSFDDYAFYERDLTNLIKSGSEWYGDKLDILTQKEINFNFPNIITSSPVYVKGDIAARIDVSQNNINSFTISGPSGSINLSPQTTNFSCYTCDFAKTANGTFTFLPSSNWFTITVTKNISSSSVVGWVNYIEVNARRSLDMSGSNQLFSNQLFFRDMPSVGAGNIAEFTISNANSFSKVWDVSDPINVKIQSATFNGSTSTLAFALPADTLKKFVAFNGSSYFTPSKAGEVPNQNLHAIQQTDMVIVAHPLFMNEANTIADLHRNQDGLDVTLVTPQQIYNEFSSGAQDIAAIRDFVKMFYDRAGSNKDQMPQYLLLFGDGSYDLKNRFSSNSNFVPAYQSANSTSYTNSYVSDDFFGLLEDNEGDMKSSDLVDVGIGRFPVRTVSEAQSVVNKVIRYTSTGISPSTETNSCNNNNASSFGDWRNMLCFIGDDEDSGIHTTQADLLAEQVHASDPVFNLDKIYLDAYFQQSTPGGSRYPDVVEAINQRIEKGVLIINYTGHGGELGLAHERIIEIPQINAWSNSRKLPLFFTATCEFSRFDDPERTSAGELVLLNPDGGAIALMSTVRLVYSAPNFTLNKSFYNHVFDTLDNGMIPRLGDIFRLTKTDGGSTDINSRNFTLLGDPALRLSYPKHDVATTSVSDDTLKALSLVTITGYVRDGSGNKMAGYNGIIYPTVFDKEDTVTTLINDPSSIKINFKQQKNILYKGKASVTNGDFTFSFVMPYDVAGNSYGIGKISYYAENGYEDANGYYENITIGGYSENAASDIIGPEVLLYLNDAKFVYGGTTNESPQLYAVLKDENGINASGVGIGHDITAILDGNRSQEIMLNDYYEADLNSYQSGTVRYPLHELSEGKHTLKLKAWDVYNNSSEAYTEFIVAPSAELALKHVLNYPNPFTTSTAFHFEHNRPCDNMNVQIQIFTISGKLVKRINTSIQCDGFKAEPIFWDGKDDYGDKIARGVYLYSLKIRSTDNSTAEQIEKLVILN